MLRYQWTVHHRLLTWLSALCCIVWPIKAHADCRVWLISRSDSTIQVVPRPLPDGQTEVYALDGRDPVTVVVATGVGQSGDLVATATPMRIITRCKSDTLIVQVKRGSSPATEIMKMTMNDLKRLNVSVSITGGDGVKARWRIDGWEHPTRETLPVIDLFKGAIPLGPRDHSIAIDITARDDTNEPPHALLSGVFSVHTQSGYPIATAQAGRPWHAVIDLAASTTVVRRAALPPNTAVQPASMRQQSADGTRQIPLAIEGAGGAVNGLGSATIPTLTIGSVTMRDVPVLVMDTLPVIKGVAVDAILGLDVLRWAGRVQLVRTNARTSAMALGDSVQTTAFATRTPDVQLPLQSAGALLAVNATIGTIPTFLILDTGSPYTVLSTTTAHALALPTTKMHGNAPRGLDGSALSMQEARLPSLTLGSVTLPAFAVRVSDLPVLAKFGTQHVGLLGFDVLGAFAAIELDFQTKTVRIWK